MSAHADDVDASAASSLQCGGAEESVKPCDPPGVPASSPAAPDTGLRTAGIQVKVDESQRELFELMALMRVPPREIIDLDERNRYESFLAARRQARD